MAQEVDLFGPEYAFVVAEDETSGAEAFKDQMQVAPVFFGGRGEDEDVIDVGNAEGEIAEAGVYHPLKGGTSVTKAKTVVESVSAEGCSDGGLRDVVWMHGDLVVALQDVQFGEYLRVEPSGHLCEDRVWNGGEDVISLGMGGSYSPKAELYFRAAKPYCSVYRRECREFEM